eukprot:2323118-Amphidinium_carterae.2
MPASPRPKPLSEGGSASATAAPSTDSVTAGIVGSGEPVSTEHLRCLPLDDPSIDISTIAFVPPKKRGRPKRQSENAVVAMPSQSALAASNPENSSPLQGFLGICAGHFASVFVEYTGRLEVQHCANLDRYMVHGFPLPSVYAATLCQCIVTSLACTSADSLDTEIIKLHSEFLTVENPYHSKSLVVRAQHLEVSEFMMSSKLARLSDAQVIFSRHLRAQMEKAIDCSYQVKHELLSVVAVAYDQTPLKTNLAIEAVGDNVGESSYSTLSGSCDAVLVLGMLQSSTDAMVTKILQSRQTFGLLVKDEQGFFHIVGQTVNSLQALESGAAEPLLSCLLRLSGATRWSEGFKFQARVTECDKAASNVKADLSLAGRASTWSYVTIAMSTTSVLFETTDQAEAEDHGRMLTLFCGFGNELEHMLLSKLPNGDWRCDEVEHFPDMGENGLRDRNAIANLLCDGLVWATARMDWSRRGAGQLGHFGSVSQLADGSIPGLRQSVCLSGNASVGPARETELTGTIHATMHDQQMGPSHPIAVDEVGAALEAETQQMHSAEDHANDRQKAAGWLSSPQHRVNLVLITLTLAPLQALLCSEFEVAAESWEVRQRSAVARHLWEHAADNVNSRHWMDTIAAQGQHDAHTCMTCKSCTLIDVFGSESLHKSFGTMH